MVTELVPDDVWDVVTVVVCEIVPVDVLVDVSVDVSVELWVEVAVVVAVVVGVVLTQFVYSLAPNAFRAELSTAAVASQPTSSFRKPPSMQVTLPVDAP